MRHKTHRCREDQHRGVAHRLQQGDERERLLVCRDHRPEELQLGWELAPVRDAHGLCHPRRRHGRVDGGLRTSHLTGLHSAAAASAAAAAPAWTGPSSQWLTQPPSQGVASPPGRPACLRGSVAPLRRGRHARCPSSCRSWARRQWKQGPQPASPVGGRAGQPQAVRRAHCMAACLV